MFNSAFVTQILNFLGVPAERPDLPTLDALVTAYTRRVPWESASRIVRKAETPVLENCPRWPEEFWKLAMSRGTGGTCYESNYAFFALLQALGYEGDLTLNDMNEHVGCHSALIIRIDSVEWLVDVGLPLYTPVKLGDSITQRGSVFHRYVLYPQGDDLIRVERDRHPSPYCYTFVHRPVSDADYRQATIRDYGENGLFLDRVIVVRVVNELVWRFASISRPYQLESFHDENKSYHFLGLTIAEAVPPLAVTFNMDADILEKALILIADNELS